MNERTNKAGATSGLNEPKSRKSEVRREGQRPVSLVPAAVIEFVLTECDFQPAVAEKLRFVIGKQSVA